MNPDRLAELEEERRFLLASIRDLDRERSVGDVDEADQLARQVARFRLDSERQAPVAAPTVVHVCDDVACLPHGAEDLCAAARATLGEPGGDGPVSWKRSPCLGLCERAPAAFVQRAGRGAPGTTTPPW